MIEEIPNMSYINKLFLEEEEPKKEFIGILYEELLLDIDSYFSFLNNKDYQKTKLFVHRIKHKMSVLGLEENYKLANTYENNVRNNNLKGKEQFESMLPIMKDFLKTIKE